MANRFFRIAAAYLILGVSLGVFMGAKEDFTFEAVHAHLNLLGWVSLAVIGLIYTVKPALAETKLAQAHFWLHNLGLPPLMVGVAFIKQGNTELGGPIAGIFSVIVWLGILCFVVNLWRGLSVRK